MQFYDNIEAVQAVYLAKALASESPRQAVKIGGKIVASSTAPAGFKYAECCPVEVTATVSNKYIKNGKVTDEAPITITSDTGDFLGGAKEVLAFVTPALGEDSLKPVSIDKGLLESTITFKAGHNFAIVSEAVTVTMYQSVFGGYYVESELPEQDQTKCLERYSNAVKAERNARLADTDPYVQISDMTVKKTKDAQRSALTDDERAEVTAYRTALRDLPEAEGFPFVAMPEIPSCIQIEAQAKIGQRQMMEAMQ
jgi:hypothetical protein|nr:MAG TPA: tail assembly chaperone [Caudoviricetes sp.]